MRAGAGHDEFFKASTGKPPIYRDGIMKVKIKRTAPWKAPPWKSDGPKNKLNKLLVTVLASTNKKLVEKTAMMTAKKARQTPIVSEHKIKN